VGCLHEDLGTAVTKALTADPAACLAHAQTYSWDASVRQFVSHIRPFPPEDFFPEANGANGAGEQPLADIAATG